METRFFYLEMELTKISAYNQASTLFAMEINQKYSDKMLLKELIDIESNNSELSPTNSEIKSSFFGSKTYIAVERGIAISTLAQKLVCEPLTYNKAMRLPKAKFRKGAMEEEVQAHEENNTWDLVDPLSDAEVV